MSAGLWSFQSLEVRSLFEPFPDSRDCPNSLARTSSTSKGRGKVSQTDCPLFAQNIISRGGSRFHTLKLHWAHKDNPGPPRHSSSPLLITSLSPFDHVKKHIHWLWELDVDNFGAVILPITQFKLLNILKVEFGAQGKKNKQMLTLKWCKWWCYQIRILKQ